MDRKDAVTSGRAAAWGRAGHPPVFSTRSGQREPRRLPCCRRHCDRRSRRGPGRQWGGGGRAAGNVCVGARVPRGGPGSLAGLRLLSDRGPGRALREGSARPRSPQSLRQSVPGPRVAAGRCGGAWASWSAGSGQRGASAGAAPGTCAASCGVWGEPSKGGAGHATHACLCESSRRSVPTAPVAGQVLCHAGSAPLGDSRLPFRPLPALTPPPPPGSCDCVEGDVVPWPAWAPGPGRPDVHPAPHPGGGCQVDAGVAGPSQAAPPHPQELGALGKVCAPRAR